MKFHIFFLLILCNSIGLSAQDEFQIDVSSNVTNQDITVNSGTYTFLMSHVDVNKQYKISAIKENQKIDKLETPEEFGIRGIGAGANVKREIGTFDLDEGEQLTISIDVFDVSTDVAGNRTTTKTSTFKYIYSTKPRGEWRTTFGFNFIYKVKQNTYFSDAGDDATFTIAEGNNKDKFDFHPTLMFSWLSNKHLCGNKNWHFGLSGGLGYDLEESLSVFAGPSFIYNENITLTVGIAFHNQKRLSSNYNKGDVINENLSFDQLHTDYIRVNPFVSLSFRLDRNPFGG